jgi:hypothetical protein
MTGRQLRNSSPATAGKLSSRATTAADPPSLGFGVAGLRAELKFVSRRALIMLTLGDPRGISISHMLRDISVAMPKTPLKLLDVVALLVDKPEERLVTGQVGTVVELLSPDVYEVEFLDSKGHTIAVTELKRAELLLLQHEPVMA